jgi:SLT domain-containing protein
MIRNAFAAAWHWIRDEVLRPAMLYWQQQVIPRWQAVVDFFHSAWDAIRNTFSSAWHWIRDEVIRPFMDYWNQRVMPHFRRVRDFFSRIWDQIRRTASSVWERIVSAVRGPVNAIIGAINALIRGINSVINLINRIPGVSIPRIPEIPRLGGGGGGGTARTSGGSRGQGPGARAARMAQGGQVPLIDPSQRGPFKTHGIRAIVGEGDPRHPEYVIPTDPRYRPRAVALFASLASDLGLGPRMGRRPEFSVPDVGPVPGYFLGGIIDSAKGAIGGVLRRVGGWVQGFTRRAIRAAIGPVNNHVKGLLNRIPNAFRLRDIAHGIRKTIVRVLVEGVGGAAPEDDPAAPSGSGRHGNYRGGGGVERWRSLALRALEYTGYPTSWIGSLLRRMNQESGGNPFAINRWDINARRGTPSMGLMQTIGPTFYSYARELAHRGPYDPFANIVAAIRYTVARYGSGPAGWDRPGGYARGGIITGFGPKIITAHGREMMLNLRQQANLFRLLDGAYRADRVFPEEPGGSKGGETTIINNINLTFNVTGAASKEEADRQLRPYLDVLEERRVLNAARLP